MQYFLRFIVCGLVITLFQTNSTAQTESVQPQSQSILALQRVDELVNEGLKKGRMPGAVVCIGNSQKIVYQKAFGYRSLQPERKPMELNTIFDLASLTKPIATATSIMLLLERGKIRLRDPVETYLPGFAVNGKKSITVQQLLTHTSGLIPDNALSDYESGRNVAIQKILDLKPRSEPGTRFAYSDVGFIVLGELVERQSGESLSQFSRKNLFGPLGMSDTGFNPDKKLHARCAVTQQRNGKWMQGEVHDPRAYRMEGIAGHAGLFSTGEDLAKYCQMMLADGRVSNQQILAPSTVQLMTRSQLLPTGIRRGLGWDKQSPYSSNRGELMSDRAFGHGGFTGTAVWVDPELDLFVIFLSNRVHPDGKGYVNRLAGMIGTVAAAEFSRRMDANK